MALTLMGNEQLAHDLLVKNNWQLVPAETLADAIGFNDMEKKMLKWFWSPDFGMSKIYLSDDLIRNNLIDETGRNAAVNFINRMVIANFVETQDYIEVNENHALVKAHFSQSSATMNENPKRPGNRKRYFVVTGDCLKDILIMSRSKNGVATRKYFFKIEKFAQLMVAYISLHRAHTLMLESKAKETLLLEATKRAEDAAAREAAAIEAKNVAEALARTTIERQKQTIQNLVTFAKQAKIKVKSGFVYITTSRAMASDNRFKLGITGSMQARMPTYNTGMSGEDNRLYYAYYRPCYDVHSLDVTLKSALSDYQARDTKEVYIMPFDRLKGIIELAVNGNDPVYEQVNKETQFGQVHPEEYYRSTTIPSAITILGNDIKRRGRPKAVAPAMLDDQEPAAISTRVAELLKEYMAAAHGVPKFTFNAPANPKAEAEAEAKPIQFSWKRFVAFIKPKVSFKTVSKIKAATNALLAHLSSVECCWREAKAAKK